VAGSRGFTRIKPIEQQKNLEQTATYGMLMGVCFYVIFLIFMQKLVLGLVGEKGSGKETFGNIVQGFLPHIKIPRIRFSDILADTLRLWGLPLTRDNMQKMVVGMREMYGHDVLASAVYQRVENWESPLVILDGVRWEADAELVRSFPRNLLVYITADVKTRFAHVQQRQEKTAEKGNWDLFLREENAENESYIPTIGASADVRIENNDTIETFKGRVEAFCRECVHKDMLG